MQDIKERNFHTKDGISIFFRTAIPENVAASLILLHGYAEHSGRYLHAINYFAERNIAVFAPDERGHGRTARLLGDIESFKFVMEDIAIIHKQIKERYPTRPVFLYGHSMGGLLAVLYAEKSEKDLKGLILSGASMILPDNVSPFLIKVARFIAKIMPKLPVQQFEYSGCSRDPKVIDAIREDPLYYKGKTRARTGNEIIQGIKEALANLKNITIPILICHGGADPIINPDASKNIYKNVGSEDKELKIFDGLYHEIHNEPEKTEVLKYLGDWIEKRI